MPLSALAQPRVLALPSSPALFLTLRQDSAEDPLPAVLRLRDGLDLDTSVLGLGQPLVAALGAEIPGLRGFLPLAGRGVSWPATQGALWLALYGQDPGQLLHEARRLLGLLGSGFAVDDSVSAYQYAEGRDLSGFLDGTANPEGEAAVEAALVDGAPGLAGGSFASTQRWIHDLDALARMSQAARDQMIGRRVSDNEEMEDAPESAHVKRTAQEEVGFLLRRSMPWGSVDQAGLVFLAYSRDPDTFVAHGRRMVGLADGVVDALYQLTRPVTGGLYWCPPVHAGRVDLRALGG